MPVSSVATLVTLPLAVSPRAPASVDGDGDLDVRRKHEADRLVVVGVDLDQQVVDQQEPVVADDRPAAA